jgi:uncharacterized RDD family membrane protein YckC
MSKCEKCGAELKQGDAFCRSCGAPVAAAQVAVTKVFDLATWGDRVLAYIIDIVILGAVVAVVKGIINVPAILSNMFGSPVPYFVPWSSPWLDGLVYFVYFVWMDYSYGQSLGKMVMRARVTGLEGQHLTLEQALLESFGKSFFPLNFLDVILGWIFYTGKNQRLFTYLARTIVIRDTRRS